MERRVGGETKGILTQLSGSGMVVEPTGVGGSDLNTKLRLGFSLFILLSTGCATDRAFKFPEGSEVVTVRVKSQEDLELSPMRVVYRSADCSFNSYTAAGESYKKDGYNEIQVTLERQGLTDSYTANLQIDGGGECKWQLSNATISFGYKFPERLVSDLVNAGENGITILFDENKSPRGSGFKVFDGDVSIKSDYYLWVFDDSRGGGPRHLSVLGQDYLYPAYQALQARAVYYEPILHPRYVAYSVPHEVRKVGNFPTVTYPDGSTGVRSTSRPDFRRLECIRAPEQCKLKIRK